MCFLIKKAKKILICVIKYDEIQLINKEGKYNAFIKGNKKHCFSSFAVFDEPYGKCRYRRAFAGGYGIVLK